MGMEVTTLSVQVKSDGIDQATKSLDNLGSQAERTEKAVDKLTNKLANTSSSFGAIKASLNELKSVMAISFPTDGANALNKAMAELSTTLSSIKGKNFKIDIGAAEVGKGAETAVKGVKSLNQAFMEGNNVFQLVGKSMYDIRNMLGGTMLAGALVAASKATIEFTDSWTLMTAKLKLAMDSTEKAVDMQNKLYQSAMELHVPLEAMAKLYTRLVPAMTEYGYSTADALSVTRAMSAALVLSGATAAETSSVLLQFSQAMQSGRLNGAEFNAVAEGAPIILRAIQKELLVTRKDLKDMGAEGEISVSIMTDVLKKMEKELTEQVAKMPMTFGKAMTDLENAMKKFMGTSEGAKGVASSLAAIVSFLATNLNTLGNIVISTAVAVGTFYAALAAYNTIVAISIARSTLLAAEVGLVGTAATASAGGIGILKVALDLIARHPVILAMSVLVGLYTMVAASAEKAITPIEEANNTINETLKLGGAAPAKFGELIAEQQSAIDKASKAIDEWKKKKEATSNYQDIIYYNERIKEQSKLLGIATEKQKEYATALEETNARLAMKIIDANIQGVRDEIALKQKQISENQKYSASQVRLYEAEKDLAKFEKGITDAKAKNAAADVSITQSKVNTTKVLIKDLQQLVEIDKAYEKLGKKEHKAPKSETEKFGDKYKKEIDNINLVISKLEEEAEQRYKLTAAQKEVLKIESFISANVDKISAAQKANLRLKQETISTIGVEIEYNKGLIKTQELLQDRYYKEQDALIATKDATAKTNLEMTRKLELLTMAQMGISESATGEQLYAISQNEAALAAVKETKAIREKSLALAELRLKTAQSPDEINLARKEISMLKEKLLALDAQSEALNNLIPLQKKQLESISKLDTKKMLEVGRTPGQVLAEGFGEAGAAIAKMAEAYKSYGDDAAKIDKYVADQRALLDSKGLGTKDNYAKIDKEVADKRIQINAQMYGSLAGAAKGFFTENSKGYQAMAKAEKAFRVIELAMAAKTALTKMALMGETLATYLFGVSAATAATEASVAPVVAAEGQKALAAGQAAVPMAAEMPGPLAFVGAAAMIALLAGIGVNLGGGGSSTPNLSAQRQETQGSGSVFGDKSAKSESTTKALEMLVDNSEISLRYNAGMLTSLKNIETALTGVAKIIIRSGVQGQVGFAAGMGTTNVKGLQSVAKAGEMGMLLTTMFAPITAITNALFSVKKSVVDSGLIQNAQSLAEVMAGGLDVMGYTDIETKKKKFGKTKTSTETNVSELSDELSTQLSLVVTGIGDSISQAAKALSMNGSSFSDALNSFVVDIGRISIQGMDAKQIQETLTNVFSKLGDDMATAVLPGLTKFQNIGEGYFETLTRVATTVATVDGIFGQFGQTFRLTGMDAIDAKMKLVDLAGGLQELASKVGSFYDHFSTATEKQANQTKIVTDEFAKLGLTMIDLNADDARIKFREIVESLKGTNLEAYNSLLNLEGVVNDLTPAFKDTASAADNFTKKAELQTRIQELTLSSSEFLTISRQKELEAMNASLRPLQMLIYKLESLKSAAENALSGLERSVNKQKSDLKAGLDAKVKSLENQKTAENAAYEASKQAIEDQAQAQMAAYDSQKQMYSNQLDSAKNLRDTLKSLFDDINSAIVELTGSQSALQDQTYQSAKAQLDTALTLARATGVLPNAESFKGTLSAVSKVDASSFGSAFDLQKEQLVTAGKLSQLNDIVGKQLTTQDATVAAIESSIASMDSIKASVDASSKAQLDSLDAQHKTNIDKINEQIDLAKKQYEDDVFYLDGLLQNAKDALDLANGTYLATKDVATALHDFNTSLQQYIAAKDAKDAQLVGQINQMSVKTASVETVNSTATATADMAAEVAALRQELAAQNKAIATNTLATAKILSRWDGDGQPETRVVA